MAGEDDFQSCEGVLWWRYNLTLPRFLPSLILVFKPQMQTTQKQEEITAEFIKTEVSNVNLLKVTDIVQGTVIEKGSREMTVDLGAHGVGIVYRGELQNAREIVRNLKPGDALSAKVVEVDNEDGYIELSLAQADKQKAWEVVQDLKEQEEIIKIKFTAFNKGGLVGDLKGLSAFLPVSQVVTNFEGKNTINNKEDIAVVLESLVGSELEIRIIDANPRTNKLIVSEKAAREESAKELAQNYEVGQIVEGVVSGVADFGAFIRFTDNPAVEGLIHVSELGYRMIENPKEVINVDDAVKAKIVDIREGKISLSLKALMPDPWTHVKEYYKEGQEVKGTVYGFHPFGAIINLDHDVQGQVHIASFGSVEEMKKQLEAGKEFTFIIESLNPEEKKFLLKLKA